MTPGVYVSGSQHFAVEPPNNKGLSSFEVSFIRDFTVCVHLHTTTIAHNYLYCHILRVCAIPTYRVY